MICLQICSIQFWLFVYHKWQRHALNISYCDILLLAFCCMHP